MRMLSKFVVAGALSAIVAVAAPANAQDAAKQRFTHEGYTYVYDVKDCLLYTSPSPRDS